MSEWKTGDFDRSLVPEIFHRFVPAHAVNSLCDIDLDKLWEGGKRLILLDVDHTIVKWKTEDFAPEIIAWIDRAKTMGFSLCIISNTRHPERLGRICEKLGIETVRGRFKPSAAMFRLALIKFKCKADQAVMIGDQLITDILGANRAGINAIWVKKMEGREFAGTKVNRFMERLLKSVIYKAVVVAPDATPASQADEQAKPIAERTIVKQIMRFCIVGGFSFIIDFGLTILLMHGISFNGVLMSQSLGTWLRETMPRLFSFSADPIGATAPILGGLASFVAMFNSFVWNRAWTFEQRGKGERIAHLRRFYTVSITGALWNALIYGALYNLIQGTLNRRTLVAKMVAAVIVAAWNFLGQRYYAFRPRKV